jgi:hypothetical protein
MKALIEKPLADIIARTRKLAAMAEERQVGALCHDGTL